MEALARLNAHVSALKHRKLQNTVTVRKFSMQMLASHKEKHVPW